jgi:hypothetical protein
VFYAENSFVFYLKNPEIHLDVMEQWLQQIVGANAKFLSDLRLVYRRRKDRRTIERYALRCLRLGGVPYDVDVGIERLEPGVVGCCCESCVRRQLEYL